MDRSKRALCGVTRREECDEYLVEIEVVSSVSPKMAAVRQADGKRGRTISGRAVARGRGKVERGGRVLEELGAEEGEVASILHGTSYPIQALHPPPIVPVKRYRQIDAPEAAVAARLSRHYACQAGLLLLPTVTALSSRYYTPALNRLRVSLDEITHRGFAAVPSIFRPRYRASLVSHEPGPTPRLPGCEADGFRRRR
ncbi:hypothetical protein KM043_008745 [Ampulex compressa]|nr:hypothetical protein KM043_008745 [Ampulex compressa]